MAERPRLVILLEEVRPHSVLQSLSLAVLGGQSTTYQIRAVFEGAGFKTKNLTIPDPYGHNYPVCTTMQWDFKSSQNSVNT
jgi:hypothetical protein